MNPVNSVTGRTFAAAVALCFGASAHAQSDDGNNPISERVGPNASQSFPEFPETTEFPDMGADQIAAPSISGMANITGIEILDDGASSAISRHDAEPLTDSVSGLKIQLDPNEQLDANWIRRQFIANDIILKPVPLDRIVSLVQLINRTFIASGYINSGLLIEGGLPQDNVPLKLRLISGRITGGRPGSSGLVVNWGPDGRNRLSDDFIINRMPAIRTEPLNAINLEREFRLLAENSAIRTINADLKPGTGPGEAHLTLTVDPQPLADLYFLAANSRSPSIGGERYAMGGSFRNALRPGDILSAELGRTEDDYDLVAGYETPFIGTRTFLNLRGGFNNAAVIDPQLRALQISASDWHIDGGFSHILQQRPLSPRRSEAGWQSARAIRVGLNVAHRQSTTKLFGQRFSFSPGAVNGRTKYTVLRLSSDLIQRGIDTVFAVSLTATQGLDGTRANIPGLVAPDENFRAMRAQVSYARRLNGQGLELRARLAGQWADGILYSGERLSAGGLQTVRGYRETLILSDTGGIGSMELAQSFSLSGKGASRNRFDPGRFSAAIFTDAAILHNREGAPASPKTLYSVGASLTWSPSPAIKAQLTYAHALNDAPIPGRRDLQDRGVHFRVTIRPLEFFHR